MNLEDVSQVVHLDREGIGGLHVYSKRTVERRTEGSDDQKGVRLVSRVIYYRVICNLVCSSKNL